MLNTIGLMKSQTRQKMSNQFGKDYIESYLKNNFNEIRHNPLFMEYASIEIGRKYNCCPKQVFHFMIENKRIRGVKTHILCFLTMKGRKIREQFRDVYISKMIKK